jgi:putative transposase
VFFDGADYRLYLDLLRVYSEDAGLRLLAYCLMPNHVHLIAEQDRTKAMASALGRTHADFARHFNLRRRSCGHVWQARYFSCPLDGAHLWRAMAYVERNPVRAGIAGEAAEFPWSSAPARLGSTRAGVVLDLEQWKAEYTREQWRKVLASTVEEESFGRRLQEASRRGRPLGDGSFVEFLEWRAGRRLRPRAVGRPRKVEVEEGEQLSLGIGI